MKKAVATILVVIFVAYISSCKPGVNPTVPPVNSITLTSTPMPAFTHTAIIPTETGTAQESPVMTYTGTVYETPTWTETAYVTPAPTFTVTPKFVLTITIDKAGMNVNVGDTVHVNVYWQILGHCGTDQELKVMNCSYHVDHIMCLAMPYYGYIDNFNIPTNGPSDVEAFYSTWILSAPMDDASGQYSFYIHVTKQAPYEMQWIQKDINTTNWPWAGASFYTWSKTITPTRTIITTSSPTRTFTATPGTTSTSTKTISPTFTKTFTPTTIPSKTATPIYAVTITADKNYAMLGDTIHITSHWSIQGTSASVQYLYNSVATPGQNVGYADNFSTTPTTDLITNKETFVLAWRINGPAYNSSGTFDYYWHITRLPAVLGTDEIVTSYTTNWANFPGYNINFGPIITATVSPTSTESPFVTETSTYTVSETQTITETWTVSPTITLTSTPAGPHWRVLGDVDLPKIDAFAVDKSTGIKYTAYIDNSHSNQIAVMQFDGNNWGQIGPYITYNVKYIYSICVDNGVPYVCYTDSSNFNYVSKYAGGAWITMNTVVYSTGEARIGSSLSMAVYNKEAYVGYNEDFLGSVFPVEQANNRKASVRKEPFGNNNTYVGNRGFSNGTINDVRLAIDAGTPYAAFFGQGTSNSITVMSYNGVTWTVLGNPDVQGGLGLGLLVNAGTPYFVCGDSNNSGKISVYSYNGANWSPVGNTGFSPASSRALGFDVDNGIPYVVYLDSTVYPSPINVMSLDGAVWVNVGPSAFTIENGVFASCIQVYLGIPYVACKDPNTGLPAIMYYQ